MRRARRRRGRPVQPVSRRRHATGLLILLAAVAAAPADDEAVRIFSADRIEFDQELPDDGRVIEATVQLPPAPADQRDARRITATVTVRPVPSGEGARRRPGDEWTRVGSLQVVVDADDGAPTTVELVRFTTGYGHGGTYTQDVTALAPLLWGPRVLRLAIGTNRKPAWEVSASLLYTAGDVGYRRPVFAEPLFFERALTADNPRLETTVVIPPGLARPRVRLLSTGHSTDGGPQNEFVTCTHVLAVDGREVVSWRPWSEAGGGLREANPWAGRRTIDGREVWSSDLDRSGWQPGLVVDPLLVPVPELTPGRHEVTLEVLGIRPEGRDHAHGYWIVSAVVLADEPWPADDAIAP